VQNPDDLTSVMPGFFIYPKKAYALHYQSMNLIEIIFLKLFKKGNANMLQEFEQNQTIGLLTDRRVNPFIRTRQRRNFDRRGAHRVGLNALTFIHEGDRTYSGRLLDISDSGANIELTDMEYIQKPSFNVGIPLLSTRQISCKKIWSKNGGQSPCRYGVRFVDLSVREKNELRKRYLLNESLLMAYAETILHKAKTQEQEQEIKTFFLIDLRRAFERLIDIDGMIAESQNDEQIMEQCAATLDRLVEAGERLDAYLDNEALINDVKQRVRSLLGHFLYQSTAFRRAFEKPHGYPGDYQTLELVYDDVAVSAGIGKYLDRYGINAPYSQAIRLRKDLMRDLLYDFIASSKQQKLNIMNLASGGCREIRELFKQTIPYQGKVNFFCIDQDELALNYSQEKLSDVDTGTFDIHLVKGNILRLEHLDVGPDNNFDMIYSIGIADYLQDRMLKKIFQDSYKKLKKGGRLVVAYKYKDRHKPIAFNWYGDWYFIPRNEGELLALIYEAIGEKNISVQLQREPTGIIFFAVITKIK